MGLGLVRARDACAPDVSAFSPIASQSNRETINVHHHRSSSSPDLSRALVPDQRQALDADFPHRTLCRGKEGLGLILDLVRFSKTDQVHSRFDGEVKIRILHQSGSLGAERSLIPILFLLSDYIPIFSLFLGHFFSQFISL